MRHQKRNPVLLICCFLAFLLVAGCGQNRDQRDFENQAFRSPDGFTQTNANGQVVDEDPDDWRIAPFFQGLVEVRPAYPNPVQTTGQISIDVEVTGIESVSGLRVIVFHHIEEVIEPIFIDQRAPLPPGLTVVPINPVELGRFNNVESALGLHRVIVTDGNENIITYGDIMVE